MIHIAFNSKRSLLSTLMRAFIVVALGLLTLASVASANQCVDLFSKDTASSMAVRSSTPEFHVESSLFPYLTTGNARELFTHNYATSDRTQFGCKAIAVSIPGQTPQVYFFATGVLMSSWNVHHVPAVERVLNISRGDFYSILRYVQGYELTARRIKGHWVITKMDIESQITQLHRMGFKPERDVEARMLEEVLSRIDEELIEFEKPSID